MNTLFGDLRSMLHVRGRGLWLTSLYRLLDQARSLDARRFQDVWLPYLNSSPASSSLRRPVRVVVDRPGWRDDMRSLSTWVPSIRFDVNMERETRSEDVFDFVTADEFAHVERFACEQWVCASSREHVMNALASTPNSGALGKVWLQIHATNADAERNLFGSHRLPRLERLDLSGSRLSLRSSSEPITGLCVETLALEYCQLSGLLIERLATIRRLEAVRRLELGRNALSRDDLMVLSRCPWLENLREISLRGNPLGDHAVESFAWAPESRLRGFTALDVAGTRLTPASLLPLLRSPYLTELESLTLDRNDMRGGFARFEDVPPIRSLRHLSLSRCSLESADAYAIAIAKGLSAVESLDLSHNTFGDSVCDAFGRGSLTLDVLQRLDLGACLLTDVAMGRLAKAELPFLSTLVLSNNRITVDGLVSLSEAAWFDGLTRLELVYTSVSREAAQALARQPEFAHVDLVYERHGL